MPVPSGEWLQKVRDKHEGQWVLAWHDNVDDELPIYLITQLPNQELLRNIKMDGGL